MNSSSNYDNDPKVVSLTRDEAGLGAAQRGLLISRLREKLRAGLSERLGLVFEQVDDAFFERADKAENNRQQSMFFDAMREIRLKRKTIEGDFLTAVQKDFDRYFAPGVLRRQARSGPRDEDELSLVDPDELEQRLAVDGMVTKAQRACEDALYLFGLRLAALANRQAQAPEEDFPLGPRAIAEAFAEAVAALEMPIQPRLVLFKLFERHVMSALEPVYEALDQELQSAGLLPNLKVEARPGRHRPATRRQGTSGAGADHGGEALEEDSRDELAAALRAFLETAHHGPQPPTPAAGFGAPPVIGAGALLSALTQLQLNQAQAPSQAPSYTPLDADRLKAELVQRAGGGAGPVALMPVDENTIDIVAMLFDFLLDDPAIPDVFRSLLGRLQIPVLKLALADRSFLTRRQHPARRLLNLIARAGYGWMPVDGEENDALLLATEKAVNRIIDASEDDPAVFEEVAADYEAFLASEQSEAFSRETRIAEQAIRREAREAGRKLAASALEQIIGEHTLPDPVRGFLLGPWRELMAGIYVGSGVGSPAWSKALDVASTLVWSLLPKETEADRAQLLAALPRLLRSLREGMHKLNLPEAERDALLSCLATEHSRLAKPGSGGGKPPATQAQEAAPVSGAPAAESILAQAVPAEAERAAGPGAAMPADRASFIARKAEEINRMIAEGRFICGGKAAQEAEEEVIEDEHQAAAMNLPEGSWLEWDGQDDAPIRMKLSWRSAISGKCFFVNRQGLKVAEMTPARLARELREGRLRVLDDAPAVEHALMAALDSLRRNASPAHTDENGQQAADQGENAPSDA